MALLYDSDALASAPLIWEMASCVRKILSDTVDREGASAALELDEEDEVVFDEDKLNARRDAINGFESVRTNWMELAATIDWAIQDSVKHLPDFHSGRVWMPRA